MLCEYDEGLRTNKGSKLVKSRMHSLLSDPFYYGKILWNRQLHHGQHQPLISQELFDRVQRILKSRRTPIYGKRNFVFQGFFRCFGCGGLITWEMHDGHTYGHCNHYRNCGQTTWVKEEDIREKIVERLRTLRIKNPRVLEWVRKALKESHKDEINYHSTALEELNDRHGKIQHRLDSLYDDKVDGKISPEFYERKSKQYLAEKEAVLSSIKKHSDASDKYHDLGVKLYDLSQRADTIYLKAKPDEKKRRLLRLVFADLKLDEGRIMFNYTKTFKLLAEAVEITNRSKITKLPENTSEIFEPLEIGSTKGKNGDFTSACPTWLPSPRDKIIDLSRFFAVLQDFNYMGMMKKRWEEIKILRVGAIKKYV